MIIEEYQGSTSPPWFLRCLFQEGKVVLLARRITKKKVRPSPFADFICKIKIRGWLIKLSKSAICYHHEHQTLEDNFVLEFDGVIQLFIHNSVYRLSQNSTSRALISSIFKSNFD